MGSNLVKKNKIKIVNITPKGKSYDYHGVITVYQLERAQYQGTSNSFVLTLLLHNFE